MQTGAKQNPHEFAGRVIIRRTLRETAARDRDNSNLLENCTIGTSVAKACLRQGGQHTKILKLPHRLRTPCPV